MTKSHVGIDTKICPVCGIEHDVGVLLDRRLKNTLEHKNVTGFEMCPEHQKLMDDGYVALVGCDESQSDIEPNGSIKPQGAYRTGAIAHVKRAVFNEFFTVPVPDGMMCFVPTNLITQLGQIPVKEE